MSFSQETHRDQHRGRTGWRCSSLANGMEQRHPAGSRHPAQETTGEPTGDEQRPQREI